MIFDGVKKNFGFGFMRLPMLESEVDIEQCKEMVDYFMSNGFNYFDTAHVYINGKSELAIKECLAKRYKRDEFILTNKLSDSCFNKEDEIEPLLDLQLEACGVDYFDFYLMHAQNARNYEKYKGCNAYKKALELKDKGKIKHLGISFHDKASVLDMILTENPEIEAVQIQFNYLDYLDPTVESKKCYDVCVKHNKPVIVMEPVKGGSLVKLPPLASEVFDKLSPRMSNAAYAIRFAASFNLIFMVLSGMSDMSQMVDNVSYMKDFKPLNDLEKKAINEVRSIFNNQNIIPCTSCRYCVEGCPKHILIPDLFSLTNAKITFSKTNMDYLGLTTNNGKASDCIKCGKCEVICPQKLPIRDLLVNVTKEFEN